MKGTVKELAIIIAAGATLAAVIFLANRCGDRPKPDTKASARAVEATKEAAAVTIEKAETKSKEVRRAARARVDKEVADAADADDLVGYLNSRSR